MKLTHAHIPYVFSVLCCWSSGPCFCVQRCWRWYHPFSSLATLCLRRRETLIRLLCQKTQVVKQGKSTHINLKWVLNQKRMKWKIYSKLAHQSSNVLTDFYKTCEVSSTHACYQTIQVTHKHTTLFTLTVLACNLLKHFKVLIQKCLRSNISLAIVFNSNGKYVVVKIPQ